MRQPHPKPMKTISTTNLDPQTQQLVREAGRGQLRLTIVEEDGRQIAEVGPVEAGEPPSLWHEYDPQAARQAWQATAGTLRGIDAESLLADLKVEREQDSSEPPLS